MTPFFRVITPFLKGHGDSRYKTGFGSRRPGKNSIRPETRNDQTGLFLRDQVCCQVLSLRRRTPWICFRGSPWTKSVCTTLKRWETHCLLVLTKDRIILGFLGWCEMDFVHPLLAMGQNPNRTPSERDPIQPLKYVLKWVVNSPTPKWYHWFLTHGRLFPWKSQANKGYPRTKTQFRMRFPAICGLDRWLGGKPILPSTKARGSNPKPQVQPPTKSYLPESELLFRDPMSQYPMQTRAALLIDFKLQ